MKNKLFFVIRKTLPILFLLLLWELASILVNHSYFLPDVISTLKALFTVLCELSTYKAIITTFLRVILGVCFGTFAGIILAILSHKFKFIYDMVSPIIKIIKAIPVASFVVLLYVSMHGGALPIFIAFLMVMPIVWQNLIDAYNSIDENLSEVCDAYEIPYMKRLKILIFPTLVRFLIPAIITSVGLAWKSEISAEIIVTTVNSIGEMIFYAQYAYDTAKVFAWTVIIVFLSIGFEFLTKRVLKYCEKRYAL